jgi:hypothetical protein
VEAHVARYDPQPTATLRDPSEEVVGVPIDLRLLTAVVDEPVVGDRDRGRPSCLDEQVVIGITRDPNMQTRIHTWLTEPDTTQIAA